MTKGVGGMVLFASEVSVLRPSRFTWLTCISSMESSWPVSKTPWPSISCLLTSSAVQVNAEARMHLLGRTRACGYSMWSWQQVKSILYFLITNDLM